MTAAIVLPSVLDIQQAEPLRAELLALRGQPVVIDAGAVERLGGLCLQVLIAARRTWEADGATIAITPASEAFAQQWTTFGAPATAVGSGDPA